MTPLSLARLLARVALAASVAWIVAWCVVALASCEAHANGVTAWGP